MKIQKIITCNKGLKLIIPYPDFDNYLYVVGRDLRGCDFSNLDLSYASFQDCKLDNASFQNSHFGEQRPSSPLFSCCSMVDTDFTDAYIEGWWQFECDSYDNMLDRFKDAIFTKDYNLDVLRENREWIKLKLIIHQLTCKYDGESYFALLKGNRTLKENAAKVNNEQLDIPHTIAEAKRIQKKAKGITILSAIMTVINIIIIFN